MFRKFRCSETLTDTFSGQSCEQSNCDFRSSLAYSCWSRVLLSYGWQANNRSINESSKDSGASVFGKPLRQGLDILTGSNFWSYSWCLGLQYHQIHKQATQRNHKECFLPKKIGLKLYPNVSIKIVLLVLYAVNLQISICSSLINIRVSVWSLLICCQLYTSIYIINNCCLWIRMFIKNNYANIIITRNLIFPHFFRIIWILLPAYF